MTWLGRTRKFLRGRALGVTQNPILHQRHAFEAATFLVRIYYGITFYLFIDALGLWSNWSSLQEIYPLWPVTWVELTGLPTAVHVIMIAWGVSSLLSALFPQRRMFRLLLFVSLFELAAFSNSFGKINHGWHSWLGIGFFFVFLPDGQVEQLRGSITKIQRYLTAFWAAQALVLGFYSLAGFWKVVVGIQQLLHGEVHAFAVDAFAYQIADRLLQTHSTSLIGPFIIAHPVWGWPLYLSALYLELFAIIAAFRPSLHRFWSISLICFHLGSYFIMTIDFSLNVLLLTLFIGRSPFTAPSSNWRTTVYDLPLIGWMMRSTINIFRNAETWMGRASHGRSPLSRAMPCRTLPLQWLGRVTARPRDTRNTGSS